MGVGPEAMHGRFGPFRLLARLGRGGMAETFVAERAGPADFVQRVCLKRVLQEHSANPDFVRAFQNEARLAALLQHPNVVSVYDFGCERQSWWMSLELVEGLDLRQLIRGVASDGQRLPLEVTLYIAAELAKALGYAHARKFTDGSAAGIVHRDVSPSNVLISYDGAVKLADFGIAKATQAVDGLKTESGFVKGKAPYMAPEQALGLDVDQRADLFALGVILFELIAGVRPYDGATDLATLKNITEGRSRSLELLAPQAPSALVELIEGLIHPKRGARVASAAEVLDALTLLPAPAPSIARTLGALAQRVSPPETIPRQGALTASDWPQLRADATTIAQRHSAADAAGRAASTPQPHVTPATPLAASSNAGAARPGRHRQIALAVTGLAAVALFAVVALLPGVPVAIAPAAPDPMRARSPVASQRAPTLDDAAPRATLDDAASPRADARRVEDAGLDAGERSRPRARREHAAPVASATVRVIVHPVGRVLVDGRDLGESPVEHALPPGQHIVEGTRGLERARRTVQLQPGQRLEIVLRP